LIIKGGPRGCGAQLGRYLVTPGKNERVGVIEVRGTVAEDVRGSLAEVDAVALCSRSSKGLYHATLNTPAHERLTPAQLARAVDRLETGLGFDGQPRVVVTHDKRDRDGALRSHVHVVWSRTDWQHGRVIPVEHNFRKHELVARELEREFGHARTQGAHVEREGRARPARTPRPYELRQAERGGLKPDEATRLITAIWQRSDAGQAFARGLAEAGFVLARGDRRDFVAIDRGGGIHSLSRRTGATAKDIHARLADLDPRALPTVQEARQIIQKQRHAPDLNHGKHHSKGRARNAGHAAFAAGNDVSARRRALIQQFASAIDLRRSNHQRNGDPPPS
jgi:hypothetical protein